MEVLLRSAPWVERLSNEAMWNTALKVQLEDQHLPDHMRRVRAGYWTEDASGDWMFQSGILPSELPKTGVVAFLGEGESEDDYLDEVDRTLQKGCRKRIVKKMRELTVSEVYSRPRIAKEAQKQGLGEGTSFDLLTGYDLSKEQDQQACWKKLIEEDPDLVVVCPPCGPFSQLQRLNYPRMRMEQAIVMLQDGLQHLEFAMQVFEWQVRRGRWALFEHPQGSAAWQEESVRRREELPGVEKVTGDQCMYGLRVKEGEELSKKSTGFMSNSEKILQRLSKRCSGDHPHQELIGGRAKKAEEYPPQLCREIVKGLREEEQGNYVWVGEYPVEDTGEDQQEDDGLEDLLDDEVERAGMNLQGPPVRGGREEDAEDEKAEEAEEDEEVNPRGVSEADKRLVRRLHVNLGHPARNDFCRALRMGKAREEVIKYVKNQFSCDLCSGQERPKAARPSTIPRHFETGKVVGVDVVYFPGLEPSQSVPVLNIIDWASCYQMLEPLEEKSAQHVWTKFQQSWARTFGMPELIVVDQGREFLGDFGRQANEAGSLIRTIGARAPWQQGRTERHGGLAKSVFMKVREQVQPDNVEEWKQCIYSTEMAKNRLFNRSGFSPAQRQLGCNIRLPGSLAGDDAYDGALMRSTATSEVSRLLEMRDRAMEEFLKHTSQEALKRAERARPRVRKEFVPGEAVFVFRKPLPKRNEDRGRELRKAVWCGPGTIIVADGPNVWISMRGELWKCAREQVRSATPEEEEAFGLLRDEFAELAKELGRKGSKRGFRDISRWAVPEDDGDMDSAEGAEPEVRRRRLNEEPEAEEGGTSSTMEAPVPEDEEEVPAGVPQSGGSSTGNGSGESSSSSSDSKEEPEEEKIEEEQLESAADSVVRNERLDGIPIGSQYQPERLKTRLQSMRFRPYVHNWFALCEEEEEGSCEEEASEDYWEFIPEERSVRRVHVQERRWNFCPSDRRGCPVKSKHLVSTRRTSRRFEDGSSREEQDNWRSTQQEIGPQRVWVGWTEFKLKPGVKESEIRWQLVASKSSDEVKEEDIKPEEWEAWRIADGEEWAKVSSSGAVKELSEEESRDIERQLMESGRSSRILPSRVVAAWERKSGSERSGGHSDWEGCCQSSHWKLDMGR